MNELIKVYITTTTHETIPITNASKLRLHNHSKSMVNCWWEVRSKVIQTIKDDVIEGAAGPP